MNISPALLWRPAGGNFDTAALRRYSKMSGMKGPRLLLTFVLTSILAVSALGGVTGKITGRVVDDNGNPMPGAQVMVEETYFGAVCDVEGHFSIMQVPPGRHVVKVSMIGFAELKITDVQVASDLTINLGTLDLTPEVIGLDAVVIKAIKPIVEIDVTDSRRQISAETLENMPVDDYTEALEAQTSMKVEGGELHVRGGRGGEVIYMVDGMVINDPLVGGNSGLNVASNAIEEMSVLTGGFNAEYGNAQSGIINLITKEGNVTTTSGTFSYKTDQLSIDGKDIIPGKFSFGTQHMQLSLGGPEPITTFLLPTLGVKLPGDNLSYFASFDANITDGYRPNGRDRPDRKVLGLSLPDKQYNSYSLSTKLTYRFKPQMKVTFSYRGSDDRNDGSSWQKRYTPDTNYRTRRTSDHMNINWTHTLSNSTFYAVNAGLFRTKYELLPGGHRPDWFPKILPVGAWGDWGEYRSFDDLLSDFEDMLILPWSYFGGSYTGSVPDFWEPWLDGEPYQDVGADGDPLTGDRDRGEGNHVWDPGEPYEDVNGNGMYDGPNGQFDFAEAFHDVNGNDRWDEGEPYQDGWDFVDVNGDGEFSSGEVAYMDYEFNGEYDPWNDLNNDGFWQPGEGDLRMDQMWVATNSYAVQYFTFVEGNGVYDPGESFTDWNGNSWWDPYDGFADPGFPAEEFFDVGIDGIPDEREEGSDPSDPAGDNYDPVSNPYGTEGNGKHDPPEWRPQYDDWNGNGEPDGDGDPNNPDSEWVDYNQNGIVDLFGEPFDDANWNGLYNEGREGTYDQWAQWHSRKESIYTLKFDLTSQIGKHHQTKTGFLLSLNEFEHKEIQYPHREYPFADDEADSATGYPDRGVFRDFYERSPIDGAFYLQDKMEFEGLIVNAGLRLDFRYLGTELKDREIYDQSGELIPIDLWTFYFSPRLGISHPITDHDVLYFNYGHFVEWPEFDKVYARDTQGPSAYSLFGNPNLQPERTVAYEFGVDHAFNDNFKVDVTGFFKDVFDLVNQWVLGDRYDRFYVYGNVDFGRIRGFEINFEKRYSNHISGTAAYGYMMATGKSSSDRSVYDSGYAGENLPLKENNLDWDERHSITLNADFRFFPGDELHLFGLGLPSDWGLNFLWKYGSGLPYTLRDELNNKVEGENVGNNARKPYTSELDIKFNKGFKLAGTNFDLILDVRNVLDRDNIREVEERWGTPWGDGRLSLRDPYNYHPRRNIRLGFKARF